MLRWYLNASRLTAFNQSLADQDLSGPLLNLSVRNRLISVLSTICKRAVSSLQYLYFMISLTGGGRSDFLSSQILASSEQILAFSSFLFECTFLVLVAHFVSSESGITLLLLK